MNIPECWQGMKRQPNNPLKASVTKRKRKEREDAGGADAVMAITVKETRRERPVKVKRPQVQVKQIVPAQQEEEEDFVEVDSLPDEEIHEEQMLAAQMDEGDEESNNRQCSRDTRQQTRDHDMLDDTAHNALYNELRCCIKNNNEQRVDKELILDSIISRQPYVKMMQNLFGSYDESCFKQVEPVKIVTKCYEESYMRECVEPQERPCAMGSNCECMFIDSNLPFICTEFILPNEEPQPEPQLCVLCLRKLTQSMFYDVMYRHGKFNGIIQNHGNICEMPNEYSKKAMLICPPWGPVHCMPLPIVAHQRNRYSVYLDYMGVKHLKQHRVAFEDFQ